MNRKQCSHSSLELVFQYGLWISQAAAWSLHHNDSSSLSISVNLYQFLSLMFCDSNHGCLSHLELNLFWGILSFFIPLQCSGISSLLKTSILIRRVVFVSWLICFLSSFLRMYLKRQQQQMTQVFGFMSTTRLLAWSWPRPDCRSHWEWTSKSGCQLSTKNSFSHISFFQTHPIIGLL